MYTSILPAYFTLFQEESLISKTSATLQHMLKVKIKEIFRKYWKIDIRQVDTHIE